MPRLDLTKAIPLPAPLVLFVEPTNVCNFKCPICPESFADYQEQAGYYQKMDWVTWAQVLVSLADWERKPVVRFYHVGEPLLNRDLGRMIASAHDLGCRTELTSNASLLHSDWPNWSWPQALLNSGLDYLRVSVYGTTDAHYQTATDSRFGLRDILENAREMRRLRERNEAEKPYIYAELVGTEPGQEQRFFEQWDGVADSCGVKAIHNWGASLVQLGGKPEKLVCPFPFYELAVKANGDVTVCCVDWRGDLTVGNVNLESLQDIWAGPRLAELRRVHLEGQRSKLVACRDCNVLNACPDNLDALVGLESVR